MMLLMWGFIFLLAVAVIFLIGLHFKQEKESQGEVGHYQQLADKVVALEGNLKKTLEIMQELVKSVHHERETLSQAVHKVHTLETQNAELLALLSKYVGHAEELKKYTQPQQESPSQEVRDF